MNISMDTKKLTTMAILTAMAFLVTALVHIPVIPAAPYLKFDPKDVIITIGAFIYGPLAGLIMSFAVGFLEMITISESGWIGFAMNFISSAAISVAASLVYRRDRTLRGAIIGLIAGIAAATGLMLLWNYLLTPLYVPGMTRDQVAGMLLPILLPFNLIKGAINATLIMLLYRPLTMVLERMRIIPKAASGESRKITPSVLIIAAVVLVALIILVVSIWQLA